MAPQSLLASIIVVMLVAGIAQWWAVRRRRRSLRRLAREWQAHYTPADRFRLSGRVGAGLPVPGAANVRVTDLIYGQRGGRYRYLFTAEYTIGTIGGPSRRWAVAAFSEPQDQPEGAIVRPSELVVAPEGEPLIERYTHLRHTLVDRAGP